MEKMELDLEVGTVVYAKLKGYPWWPARIEKEENLPKEVHKKKPRGRITGVTGVKFFGTKDYGWVNRNDIKPFVQNEAEETLQRLKSNKRRGNKLLEKSIRDAFNPSSLDEDNNSNVDIDEFNNDDESLPNNENNEKDNNQSSSLSSSTASIAITNSKEYKEEPSANDKSSPTENQESNKAPEYEKLEKKLLRLRRKLQKLVLKDGEIEPEEVGKVNEIFEEIEKFPVSVTMLRDTKMGKLMREISRRKYEHDPCNIIEKSINLISRWQTLLEENTI